MFRSSVQFLDTKDFVYNIASGVAGDLSASAGMAGDDSTAHSFASKYEPAAKTIVQAIGTSGQGLATISSRLLTMAVTYLKAEDSIAAAFIGKVDTESGISQGAQQCAPNEAYNSLPMITGSKRVHEIPVIGKFWPQGDPNKLRHAARAWAHCATLIDEAQYNASRHAADVVAQCSGAAFDAFQAYAATVYTSHPHGGTDISTSLPLMENLSGGCRLMHNTCNDYADAIDTCRDTLIALGTAAGIITVAGVILTVFTLGGSDAAAAAGDAALAADAAAAADALATAEAGAASAAVVAEAEAVVASLAARLVVTSGIAAASVVTSTVPADAAPSFNLSSAGVENIGAPLVVGPVPPPVPPPFPGYDPAQQAAAATWVQGLRERSPSYGTDDDRAYQVRVAGSPERLMSGGGANVWADGFRPADGAIIEAKNVHKQGCSPRTLQGTPGRRVQHESSSRQGRVGAQPIPGGIDNPANHAQYLEVDTRDPATVGYWQFLAAKHHVKSNICYIP